APRCRQIDRWACGQSDRAGGTIPDWHGFCQALKPVPPIGAPVKYIQDIFFVRTRPESRKLALRATIPVRVMRRQSRRVDTIAVLIVARQPFLHPIYVGGRLQEENTFEFA